MKAQSGLKGRLGDDRPLPPGGLLPGDVVNHDGSVIREGETVGWVASSMHAIGQVELAEWEGPEAPDPTEVLGAIGSHGPDAAAVPIHVALARVKQELGVVGKHDRYDQSGTRYSYRGVDRVVNAVEPILERHGVLCVPSVVEANWRDVPRANGGRSHECTITMQYRFIGPKGDHIDAVVCGEALDTSDKATTKAQSVAWRTALIQVFAIRTGDPDPDSQRIERGDAPVNPLAYRDEILDPRTSLGRLKQIRTELTTHRIVHTLVENEHGDEESLWNLAGRIGKARQESGEVDG